MVRMVRAKEDSMNAIGEEVGEHKFSDTANYGTANLPTELESL